MKEIKSSSKMELASKSWKQLKKRSTRGVLDDRRNSRLLRKVASVDLCFASSTKDDVDSRRQFKTDLSSEVVLKKYKKFFC